MYHPKWRDIVRSIILIRDECKCYLCGRVNLANHIHHIDECKNNPHPTNLITLCAQCHMKYTRGKYVLVFVLHPDRANRYYFFNSELLTLLSIHASNVTHKCK